MSQTISPESTSITLRVSELQRDLQSCPERELDALLTSAGTAPLTDAGWIKVTGPDRVRWLNGMVTNSVQDLASGQGSYNFLLNAQGRIQGDGYIFAEPDHLLLETSRSQIANLIALLDRFIIMDDVELEDLPSSGSGLLLAGPHAPDSLHRLGLEVPSATKPTLTRLVWRSKQLTVISAYSPLVPRFEIWSDGAPIAELTAELASMRVSRCAPAALETLRIYEGTPLLGIDIRDRDLPQETGASRALHFSKGCYLGQEIVERIHSRGSVHRTFGGYYLAGEAASAGLALSVDDKPVGELTSVANLHTSATEEHAHARSQIGLGYIRREALAAGKPIRYEGGIAHPTSLPFSPAKILAASLTPDT